ncbi:hypothetical protein MSG28_001846 [Choristoneura fumiferana]|uniref:Uncharacterized protein n=1 Tax=Choristoneura fumiferana TaxID=7141 RepID=A0ACC0KWR8_CHOFU|nr:hypothetical protein MSG28_001846 [Choristoneura fumiferana]
MSGARVVTSYLRSMRRTARLAAVLARRAGAGDAGGGAGWTRAVRTAAGAATISLALVAADHIYNEKRFFKAP